MLLEGRLSIKWAFIAYTIPKNRSHAIKVNVRMLAARDSTVTHTKKKSYVDIRNMYFSINNSSIVIINKIN